MTDLCRSCQAPVIWAITKNGKTMPVDAQPDEMGTIKLATMPSGKVYATVQKKLGAGLHTSHFATCPDASLHRRSQ